jgi:hypothetical protein
MREKMNYLHQLTDRYPHLSTTTSYTFRQNTATVTLCGSTDILVEMI